MSMAPDADQRPRASPADTAKMVTPRTRSILRMFAVLGVVLVAVHVAHGQLGLGGYALDSIAEDWLYAVILGAAASCLARAWLLPTERVAPAPGSTARSPRPPRLR